MLGLVVANQRGTNGMQALMAPNVPHGCKNVGVPLARHNGPNDFQTGNATDIAEDMVNLKVHQRQGLLHMLHVGGRVFQMPITNPHVSTQCCYIQSRVKAGAQQPARVQALEPLGVVDIALASRHGFTVTESPFSVTCLTASSLNSGVSLCALMDCLLCSTDRPGMSTCLGVAHPTAQGCL